MFLFHLLDLAKKVLNWTFSFQIWLNQSHFCSKFEILDLLFILEFLKLKQHFATWIQNSSYIICQKLPNHWLKIAKSLVKNCQNGHSGAGALGVVAFGPLLSKYLHSSQR